MKTLLELLEMPEAEVAKEAVDILTKLGYIVVYVEDSYVFGHHPTSAESKLMLVSHMDTVRDEKQKMDLFKVHHIIRNRTGILGGDDRCGVYVNMNLINKLDIKPYVLFTHGEECGGKGVKKFCADKVLDDFINNVHLFVEYDRKGLNDMVVYHEPENIRQLDPFLALGYEKSFGSYSDVATLSAEYQVAHVNLSVGYFNQHTINEHIYTPIVEDAIYLGHALYKNFVKYFPEQVKIKPIRTYRYSGGYQSSFFLGSGNADGDDDFDMSHIYGGAYWQDNKDKKTKEKGGSFRRCYICGIFKNPASEMDWDVTEGAWVCNTCSGSVVDDHALHYTYKYPHKCVHCKLYYKTKDVNWNNKMYGYECKSCKAKQNIPQDKKAGESTPAIVTHTKTSKVIQHPSVQTKYQCEMCESMTPQKVVFNNEVITMYDIGGVCESCFEIGIQGLWWKRSDAVGTMRNGVIVPMQNIDRSHIGGA